MSESNDRMVQALRQENERLTRQLERERRFPTINGNRTGPYTGRCHKCGSSDLWDDVTAYGCNRCDMMYCHG